MSSQNREKSTFCPLTESNLLLKVTLLFRRSSLFSVFNLGRKFNFELLMSSFLCCIFDTKQIPKGNLGNCDADSAYLYCLTVP